MTNSHQRPIGQFTVRMAALMLTSGTHCAYLGTVDGMIMHYEDLGRHNAIDKLIGFAAKEGIDTGSAVILTSGRIPVQIAYKAIAAGIPVLASLRMPTCEALSLARRYNLQLIAKAREDSYLTTD